MQGLSVVLGPAHSCAVLAPILIALRRHSSLDSKHQKVALLADPGDERGEEPRDGSTDLRERQAEGFRHFLGAVVAQAEGQHDRVVLQDGVELQIAVPDVLVLGQDDPALVCNLSSSLSEESA